MTNRWRKRRLARKRWSLNAVRKRKRLALERTQNNPVDPNNPSPKPRIAQADLRINIQCPAIGRIQFSAFYFMGKLHGGSFELSPKQFGRRLGDMFNLWLRYPG
jgi:hypothetical protein